MPISILFVCLGNICRSPAAEEILRQKAKDFPNLEIFVESCGLGDWHLGHLPDVRMRQKAQERGWTLCSRARGLQNEFFSQFDYLLAADRKVLRSLTQAAPKEHEKKLYLMTAFSPNYPNFDVPDPYYSDENGFDEVLNLLEDACQGWLEQLANPDNLWPDRSHLAFS